MNGAQSVKPLVVRGLITTALAVLARVGSVWLLGPDTSASGQLAAALDYTIAVPAVLTVTVLGWWAGASIQAVVTAWIDHWFAASLRRWRDTPRSRANDFIFVNAAAVFVTRMSNATARPIWRWVIGLATAVGCIELSWRAASAVPAPARRPADVSTVLATLVQRYADVATVGVFIGCLALFVAALYVAGLTARSLLRRHPRDDRQS